MADTREDILVRLLAVLGTIPNIRTTQRNNVDLTAIRLPAASLYDGDEETDDATDLGMRPPHRPTIVRMTPSVVLSQEADEAGSDLSTLRRELLKRVLTDTELNEQIVKTGRHGNGAIRYLGCRVDMAFGRQMLGVMQAEFLFKYALKPDEL